MSSVIRVENLSKDYQVFEKKPGLLGSVRSLVQREYKQVHAVKNLSFLIDEGELVGFIGPNGAGKTTTLKVLAGLLYPDRGKISVLGHQPWKREYEFLSDIGFIMGQKNMLWWELPAGDSFQLYKEIYNIPDSEYKETLKNLTDMLDFSELTDIQVRKLSLGQRMKAEVIAALLHRPRVLFLDEPTIGLDVVMQKTLRDFIRTYNREYKATVLLTSHYMDDVKELCRRVIVIDKGKIVFDGLLQEIITRYADHKLVEVYFENGITLDKSKLEELGVVKSLDSNMAILQVPRATATRAASELIRALPVNDINIKEPEIEDVIREVFTGKDLA